MAARKIKTAKDDTLLKNAVVEAALAHIAFDGFTDKLMDRAAKRTGTNKEEMRRLFPNGALSLLEATSESVDAEMEKRLAKLKLAAMPVRKRLLLVLLDRETFDYVCAGCGSVVGKKEQPLRRSAP